MEKDVNEGVVELKKLEWFVIWEGGRHVGCREAELYGAEGRIYRNLKAAAKTNGSYGLTVLKENKKN